MNKPDYHQLFKANVKVFASKLKQDCQQEVTEIRNNI